LAKILREIIAVALQAGRGAADPAQIQCGATASAPLTPESAPRGGEKWGMRAINRPDIPNTMRNPKNYTKESQIFVNFPLDNSEKVLYDVGQGGAMWWIVYRHPSK